MAGETNHRPYASNFEGVVGARRPGRRPARSRHTQ